MDKYYTVRFLDLRQEVTVLANTRRWAIDEAAKIFYDSGIVPRPPHWRPVRTGLRPRPHLAADHGDASPRRALSSAAGCIGAPRARLADEEAL